MSTPFWKEPERPRAERMPPRPPPDRKQSYGARVLAAIAGLALLLGGAVGAYRVIRAGTASGAHAMSLGLLLPAVVLLRYAVTGTIKPNP